MTASPSWYAAYGELHRLLTAYAGHPADDGSGVAMSGYLRHTRPGSAAAAAAQARLFASGGTDPVVRAALPPSADGAAVDPAAWLPVIADRLDRAIATGYPAPGAPVTQWEWNARFPDLGQLLGCYFNQDFPDEFADHQAALDAWLASADAVARARLAGQVGELLALDLAVPDLLTGLAELGLDVDPPTDPYTWLTHIRQAVTVD